TERESRDERKQRKALHAAAARCKTRTIHDLFGKHSWRGRSLGRRAGTLRTLTKSRKRRELLRCRRWQSSDPPALHIGASIAKAARVRKKPLRQETKECEP